MAFHQIVVPLDGSPLAERAVPVAGEIAERAGAALHFVRVHQLARYGAVPATIEAEEVVRRAEEDYLERHAREAAASYGVRASGEVLDAGPPAHVLADAIAARGADLVVMTTHGRTGASRAWLGSVADGVVRHATAPVLLVRATQHGHRHRAGLERMLIALDCSEASESVLAAAIPLALLCHAACLLLHVVRPVPMLLPDAPLGPPATALDVAATEALVAQGVAYLDRVVARLHEAGVAQVEREVAVADGVATTVLERASRTAADVVAITSHGRGLSRLVVGSVADKLLRGSSVAVLVARPPRAA